MKVVLFCGGFGMRLREYSESIPKPMVKIGYRPILWHVMKYYAHFGHTDFILCLGYKADLVKDYFLHYDETHSNNFTMSGGRVDFGLDFFAGFGSSAGCFCSAAAASEEGGFGVVATCLSKAEKSANVPARQAAHDGLLCS